MKNSLFTIYKERYRYLYTAALSICGNETDAGEILTSAIIEAGEKASFERSVRLVTEHALEYADAEDVHAEFLSDTVFSDEAPEVRRALLLKYGVGLSRRKAAEIAGINKSDAVMLFKRFADVPNISQICKAELTRGEYAPDKATFRQMLNSVSQQNAVKKVRRGGFGRAVTGILLIILICAMIWMSAVMLDYYAKVVNEPGVEAMDGNG